MKEKVRGSKVLGFRRRGVRRTLAGDSFSSLSTSLILFLSNHHHPSSMSHIVVLGGGVIGLSTAIALLDRPGTKDRVTLIAADLPHLPSGFASALNVGASAPHAPAPASYASAWAGAHHVSDAKNARDRKWDRVTLDVMSAMHDAHGQSWKEGLVWAEQKEYWVGNAEDGGDPTSSVDFYPNVSPLRPALR